MTTSEYVCNRMCRGSAALLASAQLVVLLIVPFSIGQESRSAGLFGSRTADVVVHMILSRSDGWIGRAEESEIEAEITAQVTRALEKEGVTVEHSSGGPYVLVIVDALPVPGPQGVIDVSNLVLAVHVRVQWKAKFELVGFPNVRIDPGFRYAAIWEDGMKYTVSNKHFRQSVVEWAGFIAALIPEPSPTGIYDIIDEPETDPTSTGG